MRGTSGNQRHGQLLFSKMGRALCSSCVFSLINTELYKEKFIKCMYRVKNNKKRVGMFGYKYIYIKKMALARMYKVGTADNSKKVHNFTIEVTRIITVIYNYYYYYI